MSKSICLSLIISLVPLALGACDSPSDPDFDRSEQVEAPTPAAAEVDPAAELAAAEAARANDAQTPAVAGYTGTPVADWRPWVDAEVQRLRAQRPDYVDAVMAMEPRTTRAGSLRLTGPLLRQPDAAPLLLARLTSGDESTEVRAAIVEALPRTTGDYSAALAELITVETDARVRELIAGAMWRAQAPYALEGLAVAAADADAAVRTEAVRSLGRRTDGAERSAVVIAALSDQDESVQTEAARALGNLQVDEAKAALTDRVAHGSTVVQRHALRALSRIDADYARGLPQVTALRSSDDPKLAAVADKIATGG